MQPRRGEFVCTRMRDTNLLMPSASASVCLVLASSASQPSLPDNLLTVLLDHVDAGVFI